MVLFFITFLFSAIMSAPLGGDNVPPPPYQQYFLEQRLLSSLQPRGVYENVTPSFLPPGYPPQPPSPTEQIPISFTHELPYACVGTQNRGQGFYFPLDPSLSHTGPTRGVPTPIYSSAAFLPNALHLSNSRHHLANPREGGSLGRLSVDQGNSLGRGGPLHGSPMARTHVYDEIVVPEELLLPENRVPGLLSISPDRIATAERLVTMETPERLVTPERLTTPDSLVTPDVSVTPGSSLNRPAPELPPLNSQERPPIPPRPLRTPSRTPPAIPDQLVDEPAS